MTDLVETLRAEAESALVMDVARHVADRVHEIVKTHAMTLPTVSAAIGLGAVVCQQIYAETIQFAINSMDGDADDELGVREASRSLIRDIFDIADDRAEFIGRLVTCALGAGAFDDDTPLWREAAAITGRDADTGNLLPARSTRTTEAMSDGR